MIFLALYDSSIMLISLFVCCQNMLQYSSDVRVQRDCILPEMKSFLAVGTLRFSVNRWMVHMQSYNVCHCQSSVIVQLSTNH